MRVQIKHLEAKHRVVLVIKTRKKCSSGSQDRLQVEVFTYGLSDRGGKGMHLSKDSELSSIWEWINLRGKTCYMDIFCPINITFEKCW